MIAEMYRPGTSPFKAGEREVIVSYNVDFYPDGDARPGIYKLNELFDCEERGEDNIVITPTAPRMPEFADRINRSTRAPIILLGGTFEFGRDSYRSSAGATAGLYLNAYALAAELAEAKQLGIRERPHGVLVLFDLAVMVGIVTIFAQAKTIPSKMHLSLIPVAGTALLSYGLFHYGYVWVSCIGIALGYFPHGRRTMVSSGRVCRTI